MNKHSLTLYYSVHNGGDGSAYPYFALTQELAEIDQEIVNLNEGWGEDCTGSITLESDSPITVSKRNNDWMITKESLLEDINNHLEYYKEDKEAKEIKQKIEKL